jgi:hypothetical protein
MEMERNDKIKNIKKVYIKSRIGIGSMDFYAVISMLTLKRNKSMLIASLASRQIEIRTSTCATAQNKKMDF